MPEKSPASPATFIGTNNVEIAYHQLTGEKTTLIFCGGFRSDMEGSKAIFLEEFCGDNGYGFVRFDYFGHGQSGGAFTDGSISMWLSDTLDIIDKLTTGKILIVGSSMGGWLMLLAALQRVERIHALIGIAAAPDFTDKLMWPAFSDSQKQTLLQEGVLHLPSEYGDDLPITKKLIDDGKTQCLMDAPIPLHCPIHLLQGMEDEDVPWNTALQLSDRLESTIITTHLIKDGDHRLSRPQDLALLAECIQHAAGN